MNFSTSPRTVLIVDDDEGLCRLITRLLQREGYLTETVHSGAQAVEWVQGSQADLMLLDLKLSDMDGVTLLTALDNERRGIPFVVITGQGDERAAVKMMKRGALDYVVKDANFLEHLPAVVKRSLAQLHHERQLAESEEERRRLERELLAISEQEQRRIGHDLHDGLGQTLAGVDTLLDVLKRRLSSNSPGDANAVGAISNYVKDAIQQTRMLARGLSPVQVETNGLMSALKGLTDHAATLFKVSCNFRCEEPVLLEDHARATHVYRIAQEAIHNAVRHGKARRIEVTLSHDETEVALHIASDGDSGPVTQSKNGDGMGLYTMTYRARLLGGNLQIRPVGDSSTEVVCTFPKE